MVVGAVGGGHKKSLNYGDRNAVARDLKVGDVVTNVNQFSVKFYKSVDKVIMIVNSNTKVNEDSPMTLSLLRRPPEKGVEFCSNCGQKTSGPDFRSEFCPFCGAPVSVQADEVGRQQQSPTEALSGV